jgi:hypothetical protein
MKFRKEYVFLIIIIILLASYLVFHDANRAQKGVPKLAKVAGKDITRIEITKGQEKITLNRKDPEWTLGEEAWPADSMKANSILGAIAELRLSAVVSTAKVYERYDLGDDKKIGVVAWAGDKEVRRFDVGKVGDTFQQTFVKLPNDENIYQAIKNLRETFDSKIDDLRDRKVMAIASEGIKEIKFAGPKTTVLFTRKEVPVEEKKNEDEKKGPDNKDSAAEKGDNLKPENKMTTVWQDADGKSVDPEAIQRILNKFSSLLCDSFIKDKKKEDFSSPVTTISLVSDKTYTLSIFEKNKKEDDYPAVSSENAYPFVLSSQIVDGIQREFDSHIGK